MKMVKPTKPPAALAVALLVATMLSLVEGGYIGVCYGLNGNNLPPPPQVVNFLKEYRIARIRLYEPYPDVLNALRGSGIIVSIGPRNEELENLASSPEAATSWVNTNIVPYKNDIQFKYITLGNEVIPGPLAAFVAGAMRNTRIALMSIGLTGVKVTTVLSGNALSTSFPPSAGTFSLTQVMSDICSVLVQNEAPLMLNVYPYFALISDPAHISMDYALLASTTQPPILDGGLSYNNLFDAMVDAFNAALEKINYGNVGLAIGESGWPTAGNEPYTSPANSQMYHKNLLQHILFNGTPRRPSASMDIFLFALFNENLKEAGVEQNFGFFYPSMQPVYQFW